VELVGEVEWSMGFRGFAVYRSTIIDTFRILEKGV
jgi:hypothetical protein